MFVCLRKKNRERDSMYMSVWESLICAPVYGSLPHGQDRTAQGGGHLTGHRWHQQTDRDGGDINILINNYLNNDTVYRSRREGGQEGIRRPGERT